MSQRCRPSLRTCLHRAPRTLLVALAALAACLSAPSVSAQSSANFSNPSSVINAGVPPMGGSAFTANAAVGQGYVGAASGSANFSIQSGFIPLAFLSTSGPVAPINSINIAAGGSHNCVILGGALKCWGFNHQGQQGLGNTFAFQMGAQTVTGLSSGVASVTAGYQHTCAVTVLGAAKCWGANGSGQLGIGAAGASQLTPVAVTGLGAGVVQLAAGNAHTCALMSTGGVKCWGKNTSGQLGDGSFTDRTLPVDVSGLGSGVVAIAAGGAHSCALNNGGGLVCWGSNATGQLGDGGASGTSSNVPVGVSGLASGVASVSASLQNTCVVTTGGGAKCWGANTFGAVGDGTITSRSSPTMVTGLSSGVTAIAAGSYHTCAIVTGGAVKCWGRATSGELGNEFNIGTQTPSDVPKIGVGNVAIVASQTSDLETHTCVIGSTGGAYCWGANYFATATEIPFTPSDRPLPPVITGVLPGNGQVTVAFNPPEFHNSSASTSYTVNCGGQIVTGTTLSITVTGLTNGVPVTCSMTGTNASGVGITSLPSASVTPSGLAPILSGGTAIVAFGPYTVGSTSVAKTVTFSNTGTAPLAITSATASGPFAITGNTCASVAPAASCSIQVTFSPPAAGAATGILTITSNASLGATVIDLTGTGVARTPDSYLYIPNENGDLGASAVGTVSVIDAAAGAVVATIPVGLRPSSSAINNAGTLVYVANSVGNSVSVISTATNAVVATIPITGAYGVAVSPADTRVYVNSAANLQVIDTATNTVVASIPHTTSGGAIAVSPSGKKVYVVESGLNSVAVIDAQTNTHIKSVSVLIGATGIAIKPDGSEVWVVNNANNSVSVIKTDTDTLHPATGANGTFGGLSSPWGVVFNPSGTRAYISQYGSSKLTVVDTSNFAFVQEVSMRYRGWNGDVSADGSRVFVLNFYSEDANDPLVEDKTHGNLTILDAASNSILTVVPVGNTPKTLGRMTAWGTGGLVAPAITSTAPATAAVNISYTHTFAGSGTAPYFWNISAGTLPPGLTFNTTTGVLSGTPTAIGPYSFTVQLANGVGTNATQSVAFTVGNPPAVLSASPTSIDFGPYTVGVTSAIKTVTITNTGSTALTVSSATTTGSFAVVSHNCTAVVTAAACAVQLTFSPATIGSFSGTLSITSNATGSPHSIALAGSAMARAPDSFIYIPNENADLGASTVGTVSVVDAVAGEVVATIPVGLRPSSSAVNNAGTLVYVANFGSNSVSVISTATHSVVATIAVAGAYGVAVSPADTRLYVNSGANLQVIDTATSTIIASVPHTVSGGAIAVSPSGKKVYVGEGGFNSVAVIDAQTNTYIKRVDAHVGVTGVAVTPDGSEMWVVNNGFNSVNIIKTDTDTPHPATTTTGTFGGLSSPSGVVFNPAGTRAYISQYGSSKLTVVDTSTFAILGNVSMKYRGWNGDVSADGSRIYVLNLYSADAINPAVEDKTRGNLTVVDAATNAILKVIPLGNNPKTLGRMTAWGPGALVAPAITSGTPPAGALSTAYTHTFTGTGTAPVRWSLSTGTLPAGLTLNANTGVLAGTPTAAGVFTFTVQLANGVGSNATQNVTLIIGSSGVPTVPGAPVIGVATAGNAQATISFTAPAVTGGTAITGYTASCSAASQTTRTATGSASPITVTGLTNFVSYTCTVAATNAIGTSAPSAGVVVTPAVAPTITSAATADGTVGTSFSYQIATSVAATGYSVSGTLPAGVTLNTGTGLMSGTPTQAGTFNVTVSATNAAGTGSLPIVITIGSALNITQPRGKIAAGGYHTCAITPAGGVRCWGRNTDGQLGNGVFGGTSTAPVDVVGLSSGVIALAAGNAHTCALTPAGAVKCWGRKGQYNAGPNTPTDVAGLGSGIVAIAAGFAHTCALSSAGAVTCFGATLASNASNLQYDSDPVEIFPAGSGVTAIAAGGLSSCVLRSGGQVQCWGSGALGGGTLISNSMTPVTVYPSGAAAISVGYYDTCAVTSGGGAKCFIGFTPATDVVGLTTAVAALTQGLMHYCALTSSGAVKCLGENDLGQLGDGTNVARLDPQVVSGLGAGVVEVAAGQPADTSLVPKSSGGHTCALLATGAIQCWGENTDYQLGDGTAINRNVPVGVVGFDGNVPTAPNITSSATANGTTGTPFSYQIATNIAATSYSTSGTLPAGVTLNTGTGLISGTPTEGGTFNVTVSATNAGGTGSLPIVITITAGVLQYTVTPSAGAGGSINPATPQLVTSGATTTFTVTPDAGYSVSVGGTCGGALTGSTYTTNAITANCTVAATFNLLPVLQSVVSRKVHGPAGPFDVTIDHNTPITGHVDTDPRAIGSGFTLIFTFDRAITTAGPVTSIDRFGDQAGVASAVASGNTIVVTLIGVPNNQRVQVTLSGVNGNGVATASMGFLVGDVGNNRSVSSRDISAIKARRNRPVDTTNFRADVNLSGNIDSADVTMAKSRAGLKLP